MYNDNLCLGCMNPKDGTSKCRRCGYVSNAPRVLPCLEPGTILASRYLIGRHLHINGEGITYIAMDSKTNRKVSIREYLPQTISTRRADSDTVIVRKNAQTVYNDYLADFIDVSRAVSRLKNEPAIARMLHVFECNHTAYAVYEYLDGKSLTELVRRTNRLSWDLEAAPLFEPLVSAVSAAHSIGLVHFAISPENIIMTRSGQLVLTNFGIPDGRIAETELEAELHEGFSALEQYSVEGRKGKWTDVYSLCAVILFALTGKQPPDAITRVRDPRLNVSSDLAESIPAYVVSALASGLQVHRENRTSSIDELFDELFPDAGTSHHAYRPEPRVSSGARPAAAERQHSPSRSSGSEPNQSAFSNVQSTLSDFGSRVAGSFRTFGGKVNDYLADRRSKRQEPVNQDSAGDDDGGSPWYLNLSQWQYALLSTSLTIVVLGIIAVSVFLSVRSEISGEREENRTLEIVYTQSDSDVIVSSRQSFPVPDLVGEEWSGALVSKYYYFTLIVLESEHSDDYAEGVIMEQNVPPESEQSTGTVIGVTVSLGSKMCKVPDIIGKTVSDAYTALDNAGLILGAQKEQYSDSHPFGTIISLDGTSVGASMARDSFVGVVVSLGPEE